MKLQFLGAARQVTGSRYLLDAGGLRLLIDCGMFQERKFLERNWEPSPVEPDSIDRILLTHAHLDHSGLLPKLVRDGFTKPILTTPASRDLAEIILTDSARIQEEDAAYKKKRHQREKRTGRHPVEPLYTPTDAEQTLRLFETVRYNEPRKLNDNVTVTYHDAGHILGSAMLELTVTERGETRTVLFSGDIGGCDKPIIRDPTRMDRADYLVMESTYATRDHKDNGSIEDQLSDVINRGVKAGGNILIPTFAVERAQELMYYFGRLHHEKRIPELLVFLDSPMAVNVTDVFRRHADCMDAEALEILSGGESLLRFPGMRLVRSTSESKAINRIKGSCVIMAGSGMCTGGRIKHHLFANVSRKECTIVFVGYQANGTLGQQIVSGRKMVRIHGQEHPVRAKVTQIHGLSAHADRSALLAWLNAFKSPPKRVFLTHGEEEGSLQLAEHIRDHHGLTVDVPNYRDTFELV
jgi:metallo-beta-lactamase family protein